MIVVWRRGVGVVDVAVHTLGGREEYYVVRGRRCSTQWPGSRVVWPSRRHSCPHTATAQPARWFRSALCSESLRDDSCNDA